MEEHEKESLGGLSFPAKKQIKDNTHKMQKMIILLKWMDFRYYFLLYSTRRDEQGYHAILKSKLNREMTLKCSFKLMLKKKRIMQQLSIDLCRIWTITSEFYF